MGLDSGYLTRLVHGLESEGLVEVSTDGQDSRVRAVTLTPAGVDELAEINRRSDLVAVEILAPLSDRQRERLVEAMRSVVRLLGLSGFRLEPVEPTGADARWCLEQYYAELEERFERGFRASRSLESDPAVFRPPSGVFLLGTVDGLPVACGALRLLDGGVGYIKRMWVDDTMRGTGLGRRLLQALEDAAANRGCQVVQLETNKTLTEAQALYRSAGYEEVESFNDEFYADHWFRKRLTVEVRTA
jgi:ribosomal protein S18 acetylase RimI-like enzyme